MKVNWVRLELDLKTYKAPILIPTVPVSKIQLATLAELGDSEAARRRLFELNSECSADIPGRGPFHTWDEYCRLRLDVPWFDAQNISLAIDGEAWIGLAGFSVHPRPEGGYLFSEMTGVVRQWRRQGLATALKAHNLELASRNGLRMIRTVHHPGNLAMIALNRELGFVDASWDYPS